MIEPIDPSLTIRLIALNRPNIMTLAVIVPSHDLDDIDLVSRGDEGFPAGRIEVRVCVVDELSNNTARARVGVIISVGCRRSGT